MSSQGKVALMIIGIFWGLFAIFLLGLAFSSWLEKRRRRRHKGHRRKHRNWT
jgi:uncharacterized iron-regulated membrane protein